MQVTVTDTAAGAAARIYANESWVAKRQRLANSDDGGSAVAALEPRCKHTVQGLNEHRKWVIRLIT